MADDDTDKREIVTFDDDLIKIFFEFFVRSRQSRIDFLKMLKQFLLKEIQTEDLAYYRKFFPGDAVRQAEFLVEGARKYNSKICEAINKVDLRLAEESAYLDDGM